MKANNKYVISAAVALISLSILLYFAFIAFERSPRELAQAQLQVSAQSSQSLWDQRYLQHNEVVRNKIKEFEQGRLCQILIKLDTKNRTHTEIMDSLVNEGFTCIVKP